MEHAQAHGVPLHRDIKPANILIAQDGTLKISDFGLAAGAEAAWRTTSGHGPPFMAGGKEGGFSFSLMQADGKATCGTPGYMAPEVYRCERPDVRSDIYSFGLVLAQMAAGNPLPPFMVPWTGDISSFCRGIYELQISGRMPRVEGPLRSVVHRCLSPRPSDRYGSFRELRRDLEPIWESRTGRSFETPQTEERDRRVLDQPKLFALRPWPARGGSPMLRQGPSHQSAARLRLGQQGRARSQLLVGTANRLPATTTRWRSTLETRPSGTTKVWRSWHSSDAKRR